jgi:plastocyanin
VLALVALPPAAHAHGGAVATGSVSGTVIVNTPGDDTVAYVYVLDDSDPAGTIYPYEEIGQNHQQFDTKLLVIPKGTTVYFPNNDTEEHNVFSPPPLPMDLERYGPTKAKGKGKGKKPRGPSHLYDVAGEFDLYCDIHKDMKAKIRVMPSKHFAPVNTDGSFKLEVPEGKQRIVVWTQNAYDQGVKQSVTVVAGQETKLSVPIKINAIPDEPSHLNKNRRPYEDDYGDR